MNIQTFRQMNIRMLTRAKLSTVLRLSNITSQYVQHLEELTDALKTLKQGFLPHLILSDKAKESALVKIAEINSVSPLHMSATYSRKMGSYVVLYQVIFISLEIPVSNTVSAS